MSNQLLHYSRVLSFSRQMRNNPTKGEAEFWKHARRRNLFGLKFNRQFILRYRKDQERMAYYIADFYNHKLKLVIEIDGEIHQDQFELDLLRTETLNSLGYRVLRFTNAEVFHNFETVLSEIKKYVLW